MTSSLVSQQDTTTATQKIATSDATANKQHDDVDVMMDWQPDTTRYRAAGSSANCRFYFRIVMTHPTSLSLSLILSLLPSAVSASSSSSTDAPPRQQRRRHLQDDDSNSNIGAFVWLSDAHYDAYYGTPFAEVHKAGAPCNFTDEEGGPPPYSAYGCGSPLLLVETAIAASANAVKHDLGFAEGPDFVLFTGDNTRHNSQNTPANSTATALEAVASVQQTIRLYYPNVPIVQLPALDLGNNDLDGDYYLNITSYEPCFVSSDGSALPQPTNAWLEQISIQQADTFVSQEEQATFACGGYLNRKVRDDLYVMVLNTVVWSVEHEPVASGRYAQDPFGQFAWIESELERIRSFGNGTKVHITGHVPPILQSYQSNLGDAEETKSYVDEYFLSVSSPDQIQKVIGGIAGNYSDVVAGMFFAHVHSNELRALPPGLFGSGEDDGPPMLISGSMAPCYTTTPFFSVVKYDRGPTKYPVDIVTYNLDLDENNTYSTVDNSISGSGINTTYPFRRMFDDGLVAYLGMKSLTNSEMRNYLFPSLLGIGADGDTDGVWEAYFQNWFKGTPQQCTSESGCRRGEACLVACGYFQGEWEACVASNSTVAAEACGYDDGGGGGNGNNGGSSSSSATALVPLVGLFFTVPSFFSLLSYPLQKYLL